MSLSGRKVSRESVTEGARETENGRKSRFFTSAILNFDHRFFKKRLKFEGKDAIIEVLVNFSGK